MALLHGDGFDHWGDNTDLINGGGYAMSSDSIALLHITDWPTRVRTGDWAINLPILETNGYGGVYWYKNVGGARTSIGFGIGWQFQQYPLTSAYGFAIQCAPNNFLENIQVSITISPVGEIIIWQWRPIDGLELGRSAPGKVVPGAYNYIEGKVFVDAVHGSVEVRVGGQVAILLTEVNTNGIPGNTNATVFCAGKFKFIDDTTPGHQAWDDLVIWDTTGTFNNNFMGEIRMRLMLATSNGPIQDFIPNTGNAFNEISLIPSDPANHFISSATVGDVSDFLLTQLPGNTAYAAAIVMYVNANKTDAGVCNITPGINSNGSVANGTVINPGTGAAYYNTTFETDPDTGVPFLLPALQALLSRVERTV